MPHSPINSLYRLMKIVWLIASLVSLARSLARNNLLSISYLIFYFAIYLIRDDSAFEQKKRMKIVQIDVHN